MPQALNGSFVGNATVCTGYPVVRYVTGGLTGRRGKGNRGGCRINGIPSLAPIVGIDQVISDVESPPVKLLQHPHRQRITEPPIQAIPVIQQHPLVPPPVTRKGNEDVHSGSSIKYRRGQAYFPVIFNALSIFPPGGIFSFQSINKVFGAPNNPVHLMR